MRLRFFAVAALLSVSLAARADIIYTFMITTSPFPPFDGTFVFDEPSLLTSLTTINAASITSSGPSIIDLVIDPLVSGCPITSAGSSCVEVDFVGGGRDAESYSSQFTSFGTYAANGNILTISSSAPELSSLVLLGTGLIGFAGVARKKIIRQP